MDARFKLSIAFIWPEFRGGLTAGPRAIGLMNALTGGRWLLMENSRDKPRARAFAGGRGGAGYLDGKMLIAMPDMADENFERTVIYMCAHSAGGAMGLIVNRPAGDLDFPALLKKLKIIERSEQIRVPAPGGMTKVMRGGPVEIGRGFVLHSSDFFIKDSTLPIDEGVSLTATLDILKAIANGVGPRRAILALGYVGWDAGQLESEIQRNGWLHCPADTALIFDDDIESKYYRALRKIGIEPGMFSSDAGHA
jgi:putative transcriptional regulator